MDLSAATPSSFSKQVDHAPELLVDSPVSNAKGSADFGASKLTDFRPSLGRGGLGKGLAGILGDALVADVESGLLHLIGGQDPNRGPEVHQFVADTAVGFIAAGFGADAVILARRGAGSTTASLSTQLPPSWVDSSPMAFEVLGHLWQALNSGCSGYRQVQLGRQNLWLCSRESVAGPMAVVVARPEPFDFHVQTILDRLVRSVAVAVGSSVALHNDVRVKVVIEEEVNGLSVADVSVSVLSERRRARMEASSGILAAARAAALVCDVSCDVAFAGHTELDRHTVTMVVVKDRTESPLLGLSVVPVGDMTGPAQAVFSAVSIMNGQPFSTI